MRRLSLVLLFALGCGPSSWNEFRDQYLQRHCDYAIRCGLIGASERGGCGLPDDLAIVSGTALDLAAAMDAGRMRFNSGGAKDCLDALAGGSCDRETLTRKLLLHCRNVAQPRVEPGGTCFAQSECLGGFCALGGGCPGLCVAWPAMGAPCGGATGDCDPTVATCAAPAGGGHAVCQAHKPQGEPCAGDRECAFGFLCIAAKCAPAVRPEGAACPPAPGFCDDGLACSSSNGGVCTRLLGEGAACSGPGSCGAGTACIGGLCKPWLDAGASCAPGPSSGCPASQTCDPATHVCNTASSTAPAAAHGSCATQSCTSGFYCDANQQCSYLSTLGGPCASTSACASPYRCSSDGKQCLGPFGACAP